MSLRWIKFKQVQKRDYYLKFLFKLICTLLSNMWQICILTISITHIVSWNHTLTRIVCMIILYYLSNKQPQKKRLSDIGSNLMWLDSFFQQHWVVYVCSNSTWFWSWVTWFHLLLKPSSLTLAQRHYDSVLQHLDRVPLHTDPSHLYLDPALLQSD